MGSVLKPNKNHLPWMPRPPVPIPQPFQHAVSAPERHWEAAWDTRSGRWYYQNRATGESSWDVPSGCTMTLPTRPPKDVTKVPHYPPQADLPRGWEKGWDTATSRHYYFNRHTQERSWDLPTAAGAPRMDRGCSAKRDRESVHGVMCKMGCGRPVATGRTKNGNLFDTCCRGCAKGGDHDASCRSCVSHRSDPLSPTHSHTQRSFDTSRSGSSYVADLGGSGPDLF